MNESTRTINIPIEEYKSLVAAEVLLNQLVTFLEHFDKTDNYDGDFRKNVRALLYAGKDGSEDA